MMPAPVQRLRILVLLISVTKKGHIKEFGEPHQSAGTVFIELPKADTVQIYDGYSDSEVFTAL